MTDIPLAAPAAGGESQPPDAILMAFAGPAPQRRWTVLIRLILLIPQLIVLGLLGIAVYVVAVIGWFAALITGSLPAWAAGFLGGWLRWWVRVYAYFWLLTDEYPPFSFDDADYPVRLAAAPGRLNRLAVLFRLILAVPVWVVAGLAAAGVSVALLVIWLIVLIGGRMPDPLHQALTAVLRLLARFYGYVLLLTGTYPWWGLFGDRPAPVPAAPVPPAPGSAAGEGTAAGDEPGAMWVPASAAASPGYGAPGTGQPGSAGAGDAPPGAQVTEAAPADPAAWRLVLSGGARNLVIMFLALGALAAIADVVVTTLSVNSGQQRVNAINTVSGAHTTLNNTVNSAQGQVAACGQHLACVTRVEGRVGQAFGTFASVLQSTAMPDAASAAAETSLERDTSRVAAAFRQLSAATSASQYQNILIRTGLQHTLLQFDTDYRQLGVALGAIKS